jgi:serine protease AprX
MPLFQNVRGFLDQHPGAPAIARVVRRVSIELAGDETPDTRRERRPSASRRLQLLKKGLSAALLSTTVISLPLLAPVTASASASSATSRIEDGLAQQMQTAGAGLRFPVVIEAETNSVAAVPGRDDRGQDAGKAATAASKAGGRVTSQLPALGGATAELTADQIRALANDPAVARISFDAPVHAMADPGVGAAGTPVVYQQAVGATTANLHGLTGRGVTVAVLDSGIADRPELAGRIRSRVDVVTPNAPETGDPGGHGTHVAGIIAANSATLKGIAPDADLASVRVLNADGEGHLSTVIRGLEWTIAHKSRLGIKVAVLAISGPPTTSYLTNPLSAAVEIAWRAGIVVVTAAGNNGPAAGSVGVPGNDPLVITVGATDDAGTPGRADDTVAPFSGRGPTHDGIAKPDLVAPGRRIVSLRAVGSTLERLLPDHLESPSTVRLTGTSMATSVVAGGAALLLQQRPDLSPDAVKAILTGSAWKIAGVSRTAQGAGELDLVAALATHTPTPEEARQHAIPAAGLFRGLLRLFTTGGQDLHSNDLHWNDLHWNDLHWNDLHWDASFQQHSPRLD